MQKTDAAVRISGRGRDRISFDISDLSETEVNQIESSLRVGANWIRVKDGTLEISPSWEPLLGPIEDEEMLPFWRKPTPSEKARIQYQLFEFEPVSDDSFPSIAIQSLCAYDYSPENYKAEAEKLSSYGFWCLRSRRGDDANYWEIWLLPDLWCAKGDLKEKIGRHQGKQALERAVSFLRQNVVFGTLDVSIQRLAMPPPD